MQVVYERCAGLDVHKRTVVVCAITADAQSQRCKERRTFSTMTPDLLRMRNWRKRTRGNPCRDGKYWQLLETHL